MRVAFVLPLAKASALALCSSNLFAQNEFDEAREKIAAFWTETSNPEKDPAQKAKVATDFNVLTSQLRPLIDAGILSYLNSSHAISPDDLTTQIAKALAYPYMSVNSVADADGKVSVVPLPDQNAYAIAYDIGICASCSTSWVRIAARRDNHWVLTDLLDNPEKDSAVHLAWVGSKAGPLLALYGVHWGDAHNRLDVRLYSVEKGFKEVWTLLNLSQGEIAIQGDRMTLKYWTQPTPWTGTKRPFREEQQVFEVDDQQVKQLQTKLSSVQN